MIGIELNLIINLGEIDQFAILNLPIYDHGVSLFI